MIHGRKGMGMHKHGISGHIPRGPRFKHSQRLQAEREADEAERQREKKRNAERYPTASEALTKHKRR